MMFFKQKIQSKFLALLKIYRKEHDWMLFKIK